MAPRTGKRAGRQTAGRDGVLSRVGGGISSFFSGLRRIFSLKRIAIVILAIGFLIAGLGVLYRFDSVHPVSTLMIGRMITGKPVDRRWVSLDDVSNIMKYSVIMSEDGQFCAHRGVDWAEMELVLDGALAGKKLRGAST
ncbi:MAG: transglycosylase domain-containing protein, partial [Rhizobiaceae bacterium]